MNTQLITLPIAPEKLEQRSLANKFWGSEPKRNAYVRAYNSVLTGTLNARELNEIKSAYDGNLCDDFEYQWLCLLEEIAYAITKDGKIEDYERDFIRAYREVFEIKKDKAASMFKSGASRAYTDIIADALGDGNNGLSDELLEQLSRIAKHIGVENVAAKSELTNQLAALVSNRLNELLEDGVISDFEWNTYEQYRSKLRLGALYSERDKLTIEAARNRWRAEFGDLKPVSLDFDCKLKRDERPYLAAEAKWFEFRSDRGEQKYKQIAQGTLILTTQRVILLADRGENKSISWGSVFSLKRHGLNDFELEKTRGKSPLIKVAPTGDEMDATASAIANRLFESFQS